MSAHRGTPCHSLHSPTVSPSSVRLVHWVQLVRFFRPDQYLQFIAIQGSQLEKSQPKSEGSAVLSRKFYPVSSSQFVDEITTFGVVICCYIATAFWWNHRFCQMFVSYCFHPDLRVCWQGPRFRPLNHMKSPILTCKSDIWCGWNI